MNNKFKSLLLLFLSIVVVYFYCKYFKKNNVFTEKFYNSLDSQRDVYGKPLADYDRKNYAYISVVCSGELAIFYDKASKINKYQVDSLGTFIGMTNESNKIFHFVSEYNSSENDRLMFYSKKFNTGEHWWAGHVYLNGKFYPSNASNFKIFAVEVQNNGNRPDKSKIMGQNNTQLLPTYNRVGCYVDTPDRRLPVRIYNSDENGGSEQYTITRCGEMARKAGYRYFGTQSFGQCWVGNDYGRSRTAGERDDSFCSATSYVLPNWKCGKTWTDNNTALRDCNDIPGKKTNFQTHYDGGGTDQEKDALACKLCKEWTSCKGWKRRRHEPTINLMDCYVGTASDSNSRSGERGSYHNKDIYKKAGNSWTNDIHDNQVSANIRYFGGTGNGSAWPSGRTWTRKDGNGYGQLASSCFALQPNIGGLYLNNQSMGNHLHNRWVAYEFKIEYSPMVNFCPDVNYIEFNPNGCSDPTDVPKCQSSTTDGYVASTKECKTKIDKSQYSVNDWDNMNFFSTVTNLYESIINLRNNLENQKKKECTGLNKQMLGDVIKSLEADGNWAEQTELERDTEACRLCTSNPDCEFWVRERNTNKVELKKNFSGYEKSNLQRGRFRATDFTSANDVYDIMDKIEPYFKSIADISCRMVSNLDENPLNKYDEELQDFLSKCNSDINNSIKITESSWKGSDKFIELVNKAMISSSDKYFPKGANPNKILKNNLEKNLLDFLKLARMIIIKSEALFSNCQCTEGSAKCAPC